MSTITTNRNFFEDLKDMLKANYPLIYLTTSEYDRTQQYVRNICKRNDYIFINWDSVNGLREYFINSEGKPESKEFAAEAKETKDYMFVLNYIKSQTETDSNEGVKKEVYFLEDYHPYLKEMNVVVLLRKLAERFKYFDKHLLIIGP